MLQVFFAVAAMVGATIHLGFSRERRSGVARIVGTYLIYFLLYMLGCWGCSQPTFTYSNRTAPQPRLDGPQVLLNTKLAWQT